MQFCIIFYTFSALSFALIFGTFLGPTMEPKCVPTLCFLEKRAEHFRKGSRIPSGDRLGTILVRLWIHYFDISLHHFRTEFCILRDFQRRTAETTQNARFYDVFLIFISFGSHGHGSARFWQAFVIKFRLYCSVFNLLGTSAAPERAKRAKRAELLLECRLKLISPELLLKCRLMLFLALISNLISKKSIIT